MLPTSLSRRMTSAIKTPHLLRSSTTRYSPLKCAKRDSSSLLSPFISLLQPSHSTIIQDEQNMLSSLLKSLRAIDAPQNDFDLVYDTRSRIDDLFLIVIVGEFNSGKSTLINSLIGTNLLKSGVLPTTNKICIVRHENDTVAPGGGNIWKQADNMLLGDVQEIKIDLQWLKNIAIVDTPGTNAIVSDHEHLTSQIIPRADLILFVTSAERPMSDSESVVLSKIKEWGKKVVMIVNKMDILQTPSDREQVLDFVAQHSAKLLGDTVKLLPIFGVSGRLALNAKLLNSHGNKGWAGATNWTESKFDALEKYLMSVLNQEDIIKCKLKNPLGVADRIISDSLISLDIRKKSLESDFRILEMIEENMEIYKFDIEREIALFRANVKELFSQIMIRCNKFLDENISIMNSKFLLNSESFTEEFNRQVLMDLNNPIDDIIKEMCNLISRKSHAQLCSVVNFIGNRPKIHGNSIIGSINFLNPSDTEFDASKYELIEKLKRNIKNVLVNNDQSKAGKRISGDVKESLWHTAAIQGVSVTSIGAAATSNILGMTTLLGPPGYVILGASGSMVLGMFVLPRKKELIREDFSKRIETLQSQLDTVILNDIQREIQSNENRIKDSIAPYSRFIEIEKKKVTVSTDEFTELRKITRDIQNKLR